MKDYKTIGKSGEAEFTVSKSRFIGYAKPVETENEALEFIEFIRKKHWNAAHNVPVYVIGDDFQIQRFSDDGEPSGTAGVPILDVLKKEGITNVCMVITRYFGGIKLGTGGLVRAYTHAAKIALNTCGLIFQKQFEQVFITLDYHAHGKVQNLLMECKEVIVKDTEFSDVVRLEVYVDPLYAPALESHINELTSGKGILEIMKPVYVAIPCEDLL